MSGLPAMPAPTESRAWTIAYWICQVLGWGSYTAAGLMMVLPQTGPQPVVIGGYGLFFAYSIALTHGLRVVIRRRAWLALPPARTLAHIAVAVAVLGTIQATLIVLVQAVWTRTSPLAADPGFFGWMWLNATAATATWAALYTGVTTMVRSSRQRQDAAALELGMREARLEALEAQLSPHFLFNCLNSIRGMIAENPASAQDMVTRLANLLRHNLARTAGPTEPLSAQVEVIADYLALEAIRFDERLRPTIDIDPATVDRPVASMLLQTLVENAIKHGIARLPDGGEIRIRSTLERGDLVISVENTGHLSTPTVDSTGVGLANLRERLHFIHGPAATLELEEPETGLVRAAVRIPPAPRSLPSAP